MWYLISSKKSSDSEKEIGEFQGFKLSVKAVMFGNEPDISVTMQAMRNTNVY